ncbi:Mfa1 family fimbria major subunit [Prevotellamassilia timonensis]|uniref:Mfa1 family fimbria major subunit n=1 Tax=Prevotellamassilia timonensis TaxID=1852370 RepID=UPI0023F36D3C|nr:Mfa1 family fimbria major subunit [Prevotellamassilia timonensis]MDD7439855.1 Mfa1 family fimbria major subunit [Prevotellamassilia timonensis]
MKKIYLPLALATTLALGACSSDNVIDNGGSSPIDLSKGGFVKMSLNLPTDNNRGSRATLDDGLDNEYGIKNAYLVLFEGGDDENAATIKGAYALSNSDFEAVGDDPNHVTLTKRIAFANDTKPQPGNKLYALVVLNNNGLFTVDATSHELTFASNVTPGEYTTTKNFVNFSKAIASTSANGETPFAADVTNNGIFMTNAPLCTKPGGATEPGADAKIKTLADVTNNIYTTEAEAKSKPAAEIYVERAVAKVTVQQGTEGKLEANKGNTASEISYTLNSWAVDNTNKKSYIVRQYDKSWNSINSNKVTAADASKYRFVWSTPVNPNATDANKLYRTAFAQDPEYATTTADATNYNQMASNTSMTLKAAFGNDHPQYCNENTFQVTAQNQDQTTRVVLGVKMSAPGTTTYDADLYTVNDNKEVVYTEATLAERLKNILLNEPTVKTWADAHTDVSLDITFGNDIAGATTITNATLKGKTAPGAADETFAGTFTTNFNKALPNIVRYKGGVAYYAVRIKHFGDTDTPWNKEGQGVTAGGNSNIYNTSSTDSENWFLGRYGVVRNNWYDISVNKIQTLGDATIPAFTNDPDDVLENYISVSINVLSWSKHTQGADL